MIVLVMLNEVVLALMKVLKVNMMVRMTVATMRTRTSCIRPGTSLTISLCSTSNITT